MKSLVFAEKHNLAKTIVEALKLSNETFTTFKDNNSFYLEVFFVKIIFLCHGNICRSPMAEYIFKYLVEKNNLNGMFEVVSRATSNEEIGNDIYPPAKSVLRENGISFNRHYAKRITKEEYNEADYILAMEEYNISNLRRVVGVIGVIRKVKFLILGMTEDSIKYIKKLWKDVMIF